jgi:hypothetical protein
MRRTIACRTGRILAGLLLAGLGAVLAAQDDRGTAPDLDWQFVRDFFRTHTEETLVCVKKTGFRIVVVDRTLKVLHSAGVALGKNKDLRAKVCADDDRTPEGLYRITQALYADLPQESDGYQRLKRMNAVHFSVREGYFRWNDPKKDLGTNAFGYGFFRLNYPNRRDKDRYVQAVIRGEVPKNVDGGLAGFGFGIGIHGTNDPDSIGHPASTGCIRVRNEDLRAIRRYLDPGRYVYIEH